jgi:hypothetical protein
MEKITPLLADALLKRIRQIESKSNVASLEVNQERDSLLCQMKNLIVNHSTNKD